jgi:hypothetical protein
MAEERRARGVINCDAANGDVSDGKAVGSMTRAVSM